MNALEQWIALCIARLPAGVKAELEEEYDPFSPFNLLIQQAPQVTRQSVAQSQLYELHAHLKNTPFEDGIWHEIVQLLDGPLPDEITHDLIDRGVGLTILAHVSQSEAILRRLAPLDSTARLRLVGNLYRDATRITAEFLDAFARYSEDDELSNHLAHQLASSSEKEVAFLHRIEGRAEWQLARDGRALHERALRDNAEAECAIERARITSDADEILTLYARGEFKVWLELVRNPATPLDLLTSLSQSRNFSGAPQLRQEGKKALSKRGAL